MTDTRVFAIGDQVRMRRRGGAVARVYTITEVLLDLKHHRLFRLESNNGVMRTALEPDLVLVKPIHEP